MDDEEALCDGLGFNLEVEGYQVDMAYSAEEALALNLAAYDLILLDRWGKYPGLNWHA